MSRRILSPAKYGLVPLTDHREIGARQKLYFFHDVSKGSCFFLPRGARIFNKLVDFMRNEYKIRGYHEVITPNLYNTKLWKQSGHWDYYENNMMKLKLGEHDYGLKPMNCPAHCIIYDHSHIRKFDQLPVKLADFGVLHRNELSGTIMGLTRSRKFHQDDAHIFCTNEQIESQVSECLEFARHVYETFNFSFDIKLSLRPEKFLGSSETWDKAEESLRSALKRTNLKFDEQEGEGAFYGPKIDLIVNDVSNRSQQCATIQLDFQMPEQFKLRYLDNQDQINRPVIIHRAILGSIERFIAMLAENYKGRWPFWLSPLQAQIIPVNRNLNGYAKFVCDKLRENNIWSDCDLRSTSLKLKIREATMLPYSTILVVGQQEADKKSVNSRIVCGKDNESVNVPLDRLIEMMIKFENDLVDRADIELKRELLK